MSIYRVYYMKPDHFRDFILGVEKPTLTGVTCGDTHTFLRTVTVDQKRDCIEHELEDVYFQSQGEIWSPNGEARELILAKGLRHTSMSVGDVIEDPEGRFWAVASFGFEPVAAGFGS